MGIYAGFRKRFIAIVIDTIILIPFLLMAKSLGFEGQLFEAVICWAYFSGMESSPTQGTIGKIVTGIKVVDIEGNKITWKIASVRYIGRIISFLLCFGGFLIVPFSPKKQGLHDMLAGCLVVNKAYISGNVGNI